MLMKSVLLRNKGAPHKLDTAPLDELRVMYAFGSTGLWDKNGRMLSYEILGDSFALIKRIVHLQSAFDDLSLSSDFVLSEQSLRIIAYEERIIATLLQRQLAGKIVVKLHQDKRWMAVSDSMVVEQRCNNPMFRALYAPCDNEVQLLRSRTADALPMPIRFYFHFDFPGWINLHIRIGELSTHIKLSEVWDPLETLLLFCYAIEDSRIPVELHIDEENTDSLITCLPNDSDGTVWVFISDLGHNVRLQGIVYGHEFSKELKREFKRFFAHDFKAEYWDRQHPEDYQTMLVSTYDAVMSHF